MLGAFRRNLAVIIHDTLTELRSLAAGWLPPHHDAT